MAKTKQPFNPFYLLAMLFGIVFSVTACADFVMMLRANRADGLPRPGESGFALMDLLGRHGAAILGGELAGLAFFTLAAIWLDHVRGRREVARQSISPEAQSGPLPIREGVEP